MKIHLLKKSTKKLYSFPHNHRNVKLKELKHMMNELNIELELINNTTEFNWTKCPKIFLHE